MTLTEFLLARIAEDEERARLLRDHAVLHLSGPFEPARVLAECETKRRIVERVSDTAWGGYAVRDVVLGLLALPYAGHPDFRQEWKP